MEPTFNKMPIKIIGTPNALTIESGHFLPTSLVNCWEARPTTREVSKALCVVPGTP